MAVQTLQELSELVNSLKVHQIRAGEHHRFVDIFIVEAKGRFFVRQYKFGKKSWYDAFLATPNGAMKCGDSNPYYGVNGERRMCSNSFDDEATERCEAGEEAWFSAWGYEEDGKIHARLTWNPYYLDLEQDIARMTR